MKIDDKELQMRIERGELLPDDGPDAKAYHEVFRSLKKEPEYRLPANFAETVANRLTQSQADLSKDYFWFGAGIFFLLMTCLATVLFTGFTFDLGFLNSMSQYSGLFGFAFAFIVFLNWLDKKFIKNRETHQV
jgi:hypothetical protein